MSCLASCCVASSCGLCSSVASGISKASARIAYCGIFGISLVVSWILREVGAPLLEKFPWISGSGSETHSKEWYQIQAVLRVSLGNFLFFAVFALIMIGVKDQNDRRDSWHHGGWTAKIVIWILLIILMFFMPNVIISIYGRLLTERFNLISRQCLYVALLAVSVVCYLAAFTLSGLLFIWFNPSGHDCGLNVFFIVMTIILAIAFGIIALHPKVNGSLLPASVISIYCAYICYTGLSSEPRDYACNGLHNKSTAVSTSTLILGMLTTVLSVIYSALRAGSSTTFLSPPSSPKSGATKPLLEGEEIEEGKEKKENESRPVSYSYTFFHLIFALASMYSAMLLSGWTNAYESSDLIDVGWTSTWVRIATEWVTAALYVWSLIAPLILPDREFF
ncbi:hypothetical protein FEM48_Zijuj07G0133700 [Ziziphus jujuba var. spinosa]|uniref:Serine incorporator n=1 Tax=Ziziphus jujuba var. spinosa TaxID=714518 RepID=A0A978V4W2_ZIZJJ|nr:hypothetical protein FEM48_Zijuj07G0133700 [Ziziphus jujuba var. spinosa]